MIDRLEALELLLRHVRCTPVIELPLDQVRGHVLAEDIFAGVSVPIADMSAMDGYAIRFTDLLNGAATFHVIGEAAAGKIYKGSLSAGNAVRVFTGSVIPAGADHVVIQEDIERNGDQIAVLEPQKKPGNIRAAGIDFSQGDLLIRAGKRLSAMEIAVAAAANRAGLRVSSKPKVAILANGDELILPGQPVGESSVICSTPFGLARMVEDWGGEAVFAGIAGDSEASIVSFADRFRDADIIVALGGASVGDHDHMKRAFTSLGLELVFSKVSVKPGKPTWFGKLGQASVLGLPGNPASALVCAFLFLRPLMEALLGSESGMHSGIARTRTKLEANGPRETFLRGEMSTDKEGSCWVSPAGNQDSSLLSPFLTANVFIQRPPNDPAVEAGSPVTCFTLKQ